MSRHPRCLAMDGWTFADATMPSTLGPLRRREDAHVGFVGLGCGKLSNLPCHRNSRFNDRLQNSQTTATEVKSEQHKVSENSSASAQRIMRATEQRTCRVPLFCSRPSAVGRPRHLPKAVCRLLDYARACARSCTCPLFGTLSESLVSWHSSFGRLCCVTSI